MAQVPGPAGHTEYGQRPGSLCNLEQQLFAGNYLADCGARGTQSLDGSAPFTPANTKLGLLPKRKEEETESREGPSNPQSICAVVLRYFKSKC